MKILIVNDDGIRAKGLGQLALSLSKNHDVTVVAPSKEQSGTSHSLTFHSYLNYKEYPLADSFKSFALEGTPADCVKFGIEIILKREMPDLVISGINNEMNLGTDCMYSGTVNAAIEGSMMGVKSIAVSLACKNNDYDYACKFIEKNLAKFMAVLPDANTILNINIPNTEEKKISGVCFTTTGTRVYRDEYQFIKDKGYLITGHPIEVPNFEFSDIIRTEGGYITISPIKVDFTDYKLFNKLKDYKL